MVVDVPALMCLIVIYMVILGIGGWASIRTKEEETRRNGSGLESMMLAGRNIHTVVKIFSLTATWVGGSFILGITEATYALGAVWALMPLSYALTAFLGSVFFAKTMMQNKHVTVMDPFQRKYGNVMATLLIVTALLASIIKVACTLVSLGNILTVILDLSYIVSIIIVTVVAITYTLLGLLSTMPYKDMTRLIIVFVGLWLLMPFLLTNPYSLGITQTAYNAVFQAPWVGTVELNQAGKWIDNFMALALGGLVSQSFYQRILSASSHTQTQVICFTSSVLCLLLGMPLVLTGAVAASTDWNSTAYGVPSPLERNQAGSILPIALQFLTPPYVSAIGNGAVAASIMSSMDSTLLSAASLFFANIYKNIIRKQASDQEIQWVIQISVVAIGVAGMAVSFLQSSILVFWFVGVDISYIILFPQLVCVLFCKVSNSYGASVGFVTAIILRVLSGLPFIGLPPVIRFPGYFPIRTVIMLTSFAAILLVSWVTSRSPSKGLLEPNEGQEETKDLEEQQETNMVSNSYWDEMVIYVQPAAEELH